MLIEPMDSTASIGRHFEQVKGASLGYGCGVVSSGKAVVFSGEGVRKLETVNLNATGVR